MRQFLLRCLPYISSMLAANMVHYSSLWAARESAARRVKARQRLLNSDEHEPLTFNLMFSPEMRRARYTIKLIRYSITLAHLLLFRSFIPELAFDIDQMHLWAALRILISGLLTGLITVYLDENHDQQLRTLWNPIKDFKSRNVGVAWDCLRFVGGFILVPVEEDLFFHSWLYRQLVALKKNQGYSSFTEVPLRGWRWVAGFAVSGFAALLSGKEWQSCLTSRLMIQWIVSCRGSLLDGIVVHCLRNLIINSWVVFSGQRQFW